MDGSQVRERPHSSQYNGTCDVSVERYGLGEALTRSLPFRKHAFPGSCLKEHACSNGPFLVVSGMVAQGGDPGEPGVISLTPGWCCWTRSCSHRGWNCPWVCVCGLLRTEYLLSHTHMYPYMVYTRCSTCVPWCHQWLRGSFISHSPHLLNTHC